MSQQEQEFRFVARLVRVGGGGYFAVDVPAEISRTIGKRGPVPVTAHINDIARFDASLSPAGGGRHRLRINARMRALAEIAVGDSVKVRISVHTRPQAVVLPQDLKLALRGEGALEDFLAFPPGKQNHIIDWITQSARPETREKRIQLTVEITHRRREKKLARKSR